MPLDVMLDLARGASVRNRSLAANPARQYGY